MFIWRISKLRLQNYINEKYSFKIRKDKTSFYNDPKMVGHNMAKDTVDSIESLLNKVIKDKKQKIVADILFDLDADNWHYFHNITKKDVKIYSYKYLPRKPRGLASGMNWQNNFKNHLTNSKYVSIL